MVLNLIEHSPMFPFFCERSAVVNDLSRLIMFMSFSMIALDDFMRCGFLNDRIA
jgi:hypothetical protein